MEPFSCYSLLLIIIPFLYLLIDTIARKIRKLPPSPPLSFPIFGHIHHLKKPRTFAHISDKYGPILLLYFGSRPILLVSSPSAVEECLTKHDVNFANRPKFLAGKYLGCNYTSLIWAPYDKNWRNLRKLAVTEILSNARIKSFSNLRRGEVHSMMQGLVTAAQADEHGVVDMKSTFFELMMSISMTMIAGKRSHLDEAEKAEEARKFREMTRETNAMMVLTNFPDYIPMSRWIGGRAKLLRMLEQLQARRNKFIQAVIDERRKIIAEFGNDHEEHKSMVDVLLSLQENEPEYYNDEMIRGMSLVMLIGGTETPASTMEWALSLLLNNPNALNNAYQEIQSHIGGSNRLINESDLPHLPYLQAILDETLRLYPLTLVGHHEASEDCTVQGYNIPRGTILFVNIQAIHRNPKFWEEPTSFKPERFLNVPKERFGFNYIPFGYGRRRCPAETASKVDIGLVLGSIIQCFEWARIGEELLDMTEIQGLNVSRVKPLLLKCIPRPEMIKLLV